MAGSNPEVELVVACGYGDKGFRMRPNAMVRQWLLNTGYGRLVTDQKPALLSTRAGEKVAGAARAVKSAVKGSLNLR
jgi:hypothetical protein